MTENTPATQQPSTAVTLPSEDKPTIAGLIKQLEPEIARALPRGLDADRVARLALTVVRQNAQLAACTPQSFAGALLTAAALGLEPGVNGEAYLVPYKNKHTRGVECQLIIGYQGMAKLFFQHPLASDLDAQAVYEKDEFDFAYGTGAFLTHRPSAAADRGDVIYYYAIARLSTGASKFVVLTPEEVKELRRGKVGPSGDIPDPQRWMEKKTCVRQLVKLLPRSASLSAALAADEQLGSGLRRAQVAESLNSNPVTGEIEG
jgi:recombination protein RecT